MNTLNTETYNIETYNVDIHDYKLRQVFDDYGIVTSYPINRHQFVLDVLQACVSNTTTIFDSEGNVVYYRNLKNI